MSHVASVSRIAVKFPEGLAVALLPQHVCGNQADRFDRIFQTRRMILQVGLLVEPFELFVRGDSDLECYGMQIVIQYCILTRVLDTPVLPTYLQLVPGSIIFDPHLDPFGVTSPGAIARAHLLYSVLAGLRNLNGLLRQRREPFTELCGI